MPMPALPLVVRVPLTAVLVPLVVLAVILVMSGGAYPAWMGWIFVAVFPLSGVWRRRQHLLLDADGVEVTVLRTRRFTWAEVDVFEPGSALVGGTAIVTSAGRVRSVAPCSWWGGSATASDIAVLERMRAELTGARP